MFTKTVVAAGLLMAVPGIAFAQTGQSEQQQEQRRQMQEQQQPRAGQEQEPRARMDEQSQFPNVQQDIREVTQEMVVSAASGDLEGYMDNLSENDRQRLSDIEGTEVTSLSEQFRSKWENQYGSSFDEGIEQVSLPIQVSQVQQNNAKAKLKTDEGEIQLNLEKGGLFGTSWRVDAPDSVQGQKLKQDLTQAISSIEQMQLPQNQEQAYQQVAFKLLKPISQSSGQEQSQQQQQQRSQESSRQQQPSQPGQEQSQPQQPGSQS